MYRIRSKALGLTMLAVLVLVGGNAVRTGSVIPVASWSQINGFPDATTTGVPAGTVLKPYTGPTTITTNGTVLNGVKAGCIIVAATNVLIENSYFGCTSTSGAIRIQSAPTGQPWNKVTIQDTEINGGDAENPTVGCDTPGTFGIWGADTNVTGLRLNVHGVAAGWKTDGLLQDSYMWDMHHFGPDSSCGTHNEDIIDNGEELAKPGPHVDFLPGQQCNPGQRIMHDTLLNKNPQTAAVALFNDFGPVTNVTVDDNFLAGGGWTIYGGCVPGKSAPFGVNTKITNNVLSTGYFPKVGSFGPDVYDCTGTGDVYSNNNETSVAPPPDPSGGSSPTATPSSTSTSTATAAATPTATVIPSPAPTPTPSTASNFFPIGVFLQTATSNAQNYANVGVNTYIGQYNGNTTAALTAMKAAGIDAVAPQDSVGLADVRANGSASVIKAWHNTNDEPDNAQPNGSGGYGPCIAPSTIVSEYNQMKAADPTRPVYLNFGQGVANVNYNGRGSCTGDTAMYPQYAQGADIVSFDVYPVNDGYPLDIVATGVDNLRQWAGNKPLYAFVETTNFNNTGPAPTPAQIKAETWLELIHGANGVEYFCHIFKPTFIEAGCLSIPATAAAMKADDAQITSLAPVLNDATVSNGVSVNASFRVDSLVKSHAGSTYIFSEAVNGSGNATFSVPGGGNGTVSVIGENRTLSMSGGSFQDSFASLGVHLYQLSGSTQTPAPTPTATPTSTPRPTATPTPATTPTPTTTPTPFPSSALTIFPSSDLPASVDSGDGQAVELGLKFSSDLPATVTGVRFYKSAGNTGAHTGSLWTTSGQRLAEVTFTSESASGWQTAKFSSPVAITANTTYIVSYHTTVGHYSDSSEFFANGGVNSGTLHALTNSVAGGNGVYMYGASAFPHDTYKAINYWVDVLVAPPAPIAINAAPCTVPSSTVQTGTCSGTFTAAAPGEVTLTLAGARLLGQQQFLVAWILAFLFLAGAGYYQNRKPRWNIIRRTNLQIRGRRIQSRTSATVAVVALTFALLLPVLSSFDRTSSAAVLVGNNAVQASADNDAAGLAEALQYTASASGSVGSLSLYVDSGNKATSVVVGLYTDNNGSPGSLLTKGTIAHPTSAAWNSVSVAAVPVTSGNKYWLALLGIGGQVNFRDVASGGGRTQNSAQNTLAALPATWSSGENWANSPASFYASAATTTTPTPTPPPTPSPVQINGVPCQVLLYGLQQTGTCTGTFTPTSSSPTPTSQPTSTSTPATTATPTATATPAPTSTPTPTSTPASGSNCFAAPGSCGYPDPAYGNVGAGNCAFLPKFNPANLPAGTYYSGSGNDLEITSNNVTLSNLNLGNFNIYISSVNNLTLNHVCMNIDGGDDEGSMGVIIPAGVTGTVIENSTISGMNSTSQSLGAAIDNNGSGTVIENDYFYNVGGAGPGAGGGSAVVKDNYELVNATVPQEHYEPVYCSDNTLTIDHNTLLNIQDQTAAIFCNTGGGSGGACDNHLTITNNLMAGGDYVLQPCANASSMGSSTMSILNNRFSRGYYPNGGTYGLTAYIYCNSPPAKGQTQTWAGNVWDDNNASIAC